MTEFRTLLSNFVKKSQINGLLKNDGTVDTTSYISTSNTQGLLKNDGTVDTTNYLSTHQDITGKEDKSNKVTSISSSSTDTQYPSAKAVKDNLDLKVDNYSKVVTSFFMPNYVYSTNNWIDDNHVEISGGGSLSFDFSSLEDVGDYIEFTCEGSGGNPIGGIDGNIILITKNIRVTKTSNGFEYLAYSLTNEEISGDFDGKFGIGNNMGTTCTMYFSSKRLYHTVPLIDRIYPIGAIYLSVNSVNPSLFIGGTWVQLKDRFLLGSGDTYANGSTGGSATVTLTSAQSGVPAHSHKYNDYNTTYTLKTTNRKPGTSTAVAYGTSLTAGGGATERTSSKNTAANASQAHENMPPYMAVYMWKRTA